MVSPITTPCENEVHTVPIRITAALAGRDRVGKNRLRQWENTAAANPLQTTAEDEHDHVMRCGTGGGAGHEDTDAREHHGAPPVDVAQLPIPPCPRPACPPAPAP